MKRVLVAACYLVGMIALGAAGLLTLVAVPRVLGHRSARPVVGPVVSIRPATPTPVPTEVPTPTATPEVALEPSPYGPNRLIIPALGVNSAWMGLGYLSDGLTMASPPGPSDLGWYTFSGRPGGASNAVFAGHVDWYTGAPALFAHLTALGPGSELEVSREDGMLMKYHVVSAVWYDFLHTDATTIIAPTTVPTVTLITCGGVFDTVTHEYDRRLVVKAVAQ